MNDQVSDEGRGSELVSFRLAQRHELIPRLALLRILDAGVTFGSLMSHAPTFLMMPHEPHSRRLAGGVDVDERSAASSLDP